MRLVSVYLSLICILVFAVEGFSQPDIETVFNRGLQNSEAGRWDEAIRDFTEVIRLNPNKSAPYYRRGLCYINKKMAEIQTSSQVKSSKNQTKSQNSLNAIADFTKVIQLNEHTVFAGYYGRATINRLENEFESAILDYENVLKILQKLPNYEKDSFYQEAKSWLTKTRNDYSQNLMNQATETNLLGLVLRQNLDKLSGNEQIESQRQIDDYQKKSKNLYLKAALNFRPNDYETFIARAKCYEVLESWDLVVADYTEALKIQPDDITTIMIRAGIYRKLGKIQTALSEFSRIIAIKNVPLRYKLSQNNAYLRRAEILKEQGKLDEALADLNSVITSNAEFSAAYLDRGKIYVLKGNAEMAKADFKKLSDKGLYLSEVKEQLNILEGKTKTVNSTSKTAAEYLVNAKKAIAELNYKQAVSELNETIKLSPNSGEAYYYRAIALSQMEMIDEAIVDLTKTIMFNYRRDLAYFNRGILYTRKKDYYWAIDSLTKSLEVDSKFAETYLARGIAYYHSKDYEKSIADFTQAINLAPNSPNNYLWRANSLCKRNLILSASKDHQKALELGAKVGKVCESLP